MPARKSPKQLDREIAHALAKKPRRKSARSESGIGTLPEATLEQRLKSLSIWQLMDAARSLAKDPENDKLVTAVLDALEKRMPEGFDAFVAEIYPT